MQGALSSCFFVGLSLKICTRETFFYKDNIWDVKYISNRRGGSNMEQLQVKRSSLQRAKMTLGVLALIIVAI
ncbi:hypothetical protein GCM10008013_40540 [Paenibacillus segetis]|uniref:Uncharacterized protein n=1 Tax=Paenibacillus segetis TaxID=1325360 RepID=A0ABQ1YSP0_9BACL|nr:hypothetical protein GCM10008013_40540 [Paenibacillus segetis]